jgi:uncharacterized metal-binding protein YceD (DUF177 family)
VSELTRLLRLADLPAGTIARRVEANEQERAALAERFGLLSLDRLTAEVEVRRTADGAELTGRFHADYAQACVVSGEALHRQADEPVHLRFSRHAEPSGEEHELVESDLDVLPVEGEAVDLGEAVAQSLAVTLDPYPRADEVVLAEARRRLTTEEAAAEARERDRARNNPFRVIEGGAGG